MFTHHDAKSIFEQPTHSKQIEPKVKMVRHTKISFFNSTEITVPRRFSTSAEKAGG